LISPAKGIGTYATVASDDGSDIANSVSKVADADAVVLVVGLQSEGVRPSDEAEGKDRGSLLLPGNQDDFVKQVAAAAAKKKIPVAVVVMGGGPVDVSAIKANPDVSAIMWCGYPGQSGGDAIADVIFGKVNPSGKLSMTWYPEELTKQVTIKDMGMRPNQKTGNPGRTYRFYTGTPVFKFGEGLSYSSFDSKVVAAPTNILLEQFPRDLTLSSLSKTSLATVQVKTTNPSTRDGSESVLLFLASPSAGTNGEPIQSLVAFDKIHVGAGSSVLTSLNIKAHHFALASATGERSAAIGVWKLWVGHDGKDRAVDITVTDAVVKVV
jgi:hypothetical protein